MNEKKTIMVGIQVTPSFLQKLSADPGSPERTAAARTVFEEMERVERDIKKALDEAVNEFQAGTLEWDKEPE